MEPGESDSRHLLVVRCSRCYVSHKAPTLDLSDSLTTSSTQTLNEVKPWSCPLSLVCAPQICRPFINSQPGQFTSPENRLFAALRRGGMMSTADSPEECPDCKVLFTVNAVDAKRLLTFYVCSSDQLKKNWRKCFKQIAGISPHYPIHTCLAVVYLTVSHSAPEETTGHKICLRYRRHFSKKSILNTSML